MKRNCAAWPACSALLLLVTGLAAHAATEIKGAPILAHPCGKTGVKQMGLLNQGKMDEAQALATPETRAKWEQVPAADRTVMTSLSKAVSPTEAEFAADIKSHGVLTVDGSAATLTVVKKTADASGSSTSTMTMRFKTEGGGCLVHR